ncbi:MAG TPA: isoprenylcysteine carboxylmethyltransferase family protein [Reyranella sp.]|nr:isoprenylcysteine carboxylmethyltransferase family protein [Reyranella sp.]
MGGLVSVLYGSVAYTLFLGTILYAIAFVGGLPAPKTIDSGAPGPLPLALIVNTALLGLFAVQHSVMARPAFKRWWKAIVPDSVERSTYVIFSSLALVLLFWQWQPMPQPIWSVTDPTGVVILRVVFWAGWALVFLSTFLINHFELFGLRQVWCRLTGKTLPPPAFRTPSLYRHVRHPLYLGFLLAFWSTPVMTMGHLLFAAATTGYILIAIQLEERDLIAIFGDRYRRYREQVSMLIPLPWRRARIQEISAAEVDKL